MASEVQIATTTVFASTESQANAKPPPASSSNDDPNASEVSTLERPDVDQYASLIGGFMAHPTASVSPSPKLFGMNYREFPHTPGFTSGPA
ncbi:hypothetical protein GQ600_17216 [Phytophthora cactorum]|nr:hypothetical protein GQ600_17216 [Phytophthora cactorum]